MINGDPRPEHDFNFIPGWWSPSDNKWNSGMVAEWNSGFLEGCYLNII